ncbi:MAG: hypothetical protein PHW72_01835 [Candidatus Pacebacteria bacterium]|nr:hypothetical protein [Candidatus Paceibacterota bacterium]
MKTSETFGAFAGGLIGGALVDFIFITFVGPSALFSLIGITERWAVFSAHCLLGSLLGVIFIIFFYKLLEKVNIWVKGFLWGMVCMILFGGIPAFFYYPFFPGPIIILSGFLVWSILGLMIVLGIKASKK